MADQMQLFDTSEKQSSNSTGKAKRKWQMVSRDGATGTVQMVVTLLGAVDSAVCVTIAMIIRMDVRASGR